MGNLNSVKKIDVPSEHWDRLFAPSACLVMITTVDDAGRVNAASFGTCVRVCHDPVYIAFTVGATKDTYHNALATNQFVVNVPPFEREILEKVRVVGLEFPPQVNELEKAGTLRAPVQDRQTSPHRGVPKPFRVRGRVDQAVAAPAHGRRESSRRVSGRRLRGRGRIHPVGQAQAGALLRQRV